MAKIHYMGWSEAYDDLHPLKNMRRVHCKRGGASAGIEENDQVIVEWGARGDSYHAVVLSLGELDCAQVEFSTFGDKWAHWVCGTDIVRKTSSRVGSRAQRR